MIVKDAQPAEVQSHRNEEPEYDDAPPPYEEIAGLSSFADPMLAPGPSVPYPLPHHSVAIQQETSHRRPSLAATSFSSSQHHIRSPSLSTAPPLSHPPQDRAVSSLSLDSRSDLLTGIYFIDPALAFPSPQKQQDRSADRAHERNVRQAFGFEPGEEDGGNTSEAADSRGCRRSTPRPQVNATFRTRSGDIKATLWIVESEAVARTAAVSKDAARKVRARAMLSSREGKIEAMIAEIHPTRCIDLDVSTREGDITVFLPLTFNGMVTFRRQRGTTDIAFLPAFAALARIVRRSKNEMLVSLSSTTPHTETSIPSEGEDYCIIGTREGRITVGLYGQDEGAAVAQPEGRIGGIVGALVGIGVRSAATVLQASTNLGISTVQATVSTALGSAMLVKDHAMDKAARARLSAVEGGRQARAQLMQARGEILQARSQFRPQG